MRSLRNGTWVTGDTMEFYLYTLIKDYEVLHPGEKKFISIPSKLVEHAMIHGNNGMAHPDKCWRKFGMDKLFDYQTILIPVNTGGHWVLFIVNIEESKLTLRCHDSLRRPEDDPIVSTVASRKVVTEFLRTHWETYREGDLPDVTTNDDHSNDPCQTNDYDCGVFVMHYARCLVRGEATNPQGVENRVTMLRNWLLTTIHKYGLHD